ncbi:MAG: stage II sporulation protein M [Pirellulaceae bacterium]|nr:stage II sporulation protein M [Pirellulaceae bacterium]
MSTHADHLAERRHQWQELEQALPGLAVWRLRKCHGRELMRVSDLYRSACADLAMAEQYRLSPETVAYLHDLVGRSHNAIYRSRRFQYGQWIDVLFREAPQQIFQDRCVHLCGLLFFGLFALAAFVSWNAAMFPGVAERILGAAQIEMMETMYEKVDFSQAGGGNFEMVGFYIYHNTGIGLSCFAMGPLIVPGLWTTAYNATTLGATFGYMARPETPGGDNLLHFVTAHGAFELTAIALAAAAGLRIGCGWLFTSGLTRLSSLQLHTRRAVPIMAASAVLFVLAAFTEGMLSPSGVPYLFKAMFGMFSSGLLMFYFVVLGYPRQDQHATGPH